MARVARMYHSRGMRQADIAAELHVSQPRVSRLLKRAVEVGIVHTIVSLPPGVHTDLEEELERAYGLEQAVVVDAGGAGRTSRPRSVPRRRSTSPRPSSAATPWGCPRGRRRCWRR
ncbi:MarR family transcriptional regulator [Litorihabitans aurantiacus]|uniref:MarR family transcriptional regulator n=1 Tax=Litorihabitans aurantiacus TaxID=1930061 RepID=A0AA38CU75_9MICO|nr:MarR family transcriptional regulator [Litorihabitans aurantiacus]GMA32484.1 hypothetical protein GCM10025875_24760 [Litorihabitans aurantiacus]